MKKLLSVFLVLMLFFVIMFPNSAMALGKSSTSDLVTNVVQSAENKITFKINGAKYSGVSYSISECSSDSYTKAFPLAGKLVSLGSANKNTNVSVLVPKMGTYMIQSKSGSKEDIDFITVNYTKTIYSEKYKWTQERISKYNLEKGLSLGACGVVSIVLGFTPAAPIGIAMAVSCTSYGIVDTVVQYNASTRNIKIVPILNYSWQYKYVPNKTGYSIFLLVYNEKNTLLEPYNIGTVVFR